MRPNTSDLLGPPRRVDLPRVKPRIERVERYEPYVEAIKVEEDEWQSDLLSDAERVAAEVRRLGPLDLSWTDADEEVIRIAIQTSLGQWKRAAYQLDVKAAPSLAVRRADTTHPHLSSGYYVSRAYRGLWFVLMLLALGWGVISGVSLATDSLFSTSAVLMGMLAVIVLAATLMVAGSRERIRRRPR